MGQTALPKFEIIESTHATMDMSIIGLFLQTDMVVKTVMILLMLASLWCWAIMIDKLWSFYQLKIRMQRFERIFWSGQILESLYERVKERIDNPLSSMFVAAMHEWDKCTPFLTRSYSEAQAIIKDRLQQSMQLAQNKALQALETRISFLATSASSAPFIGLFGTVWGIMTSFQSIALSKNTTLAVVAPGIAEALLATAIGLFVAIPASIFYNKIVHDIEILNNKLDDFSQELSTLLCKELEKGPQ